MTFFSQVYGVRANASFTVEVKARLWNSTLVEDYTSVDRVEIISKASVIVDPVYTQEVRHFDFLLQNHNSCNPSFLLRPKRSDKMQTHRIEEMVK